MNKISNYDFTGKTAFITGAASGIGRATALMFAHAKAKVMLADLDQDGGAITTRLIRENGGTAQLVQCDVTRENEIASAVEKTLQCFGSINFAFNNAGIEGVPSPTADCALENWQKVLQTNLTGAFLCMKHQIPVMLKQGSGSIVNCSSVAGLTGFNGMSAYVSAKHGLLGLTKSAALDYAKANIRINAVCPGIIQTPMIERFTQGRPENLKDLTSSEPIGRVGFPEEVAEAVLWLCSDASSFVLGATLSVDGGMSAQ